MKYNSIIPVVLFGLIIIIMIVIAAQSGGRRDKSTINETPDSIREDLENFIRVSNMTPFEIMDLERKIEELEDEVEFWQDLYYSTEEGQEDTEKSAREFYTKRYKDASKETIDSLVQVEKDKYKK